MLKTAVQLNIYVENSIFCVNRRFYYIYFRAVNKSLFLHNICRYTVYNYKYKMLNYFY